MVDVEVRKQAMRIFYSDELALKDKENQEKLAAKDEIIASKDLEIASKNCDLASKDRDLAFKDAKISELINGVREIKRLNNLSEESLAIVNSLLKDYD